MQVDREKCVGCGKCLPYCPVQAIRIVKKKASIDQDACLECGACLRSEVCAPQALYLQELVWPRTIRAAFSGTNYIGYDQVLEKMSMPRREFQVARHWGGGRGTSEMKTNDVTDAFREDEVGIGCEMGRPGTGFCFSDLEKVTRRLVENRVELLPVNPVTQLLDARTGSIRKEFAAIRDERALSAIIEVKVGIERAVDVLEVLRKVAEELDTVFSVNIINRCKGGEIPLLGRLAEAGIEVAINGKTCVGLGRIPS